MTGRDDFLPASRSVTFNIPSDLYILGVIELPGCVLRSLDYPLAPLVLGVILDPIAETNLRHSLMTDANWLTFLTRPVSALFLLIAIASRSGSASFGTAVAVLPRRLLRRTSLRPTRPDKPERLS